MKMQNTAEPLLTRFPVTQNATPLEMDFLKRGFEDKLRELYAEFQRGECSFGYMAEQMGLNTWELDDLLESRGVRSRNLWGNQRNPA